MSSSKIIEVTPDNVFDMGVLCGGDAKYPEGRMKKIKWYQERYKEGLKIKISVDEDGIKTGMIEYVPGEYAFRTIQAKGYTVIHCLQVLRSHTRQGFGSLLLNECIKDAGNTSGIALLTSSKPWVNDKKFFLKNGFKIVDKAPPYFELLVRPFRESPLPFLNDGWEDRALKCGGGITVFYSDQCPIVDYAVKNIEEASKECGLTVRYQKMDTCMDAQNAPFPYGTFGIIKDGKFLTHRIYDKDTYVVLLKNG
jgi:GNAT superfamily N-acetyltransferase